MAILLLVVLLVALNGIDGAKVGIVGGREAARNSRPYMASLQSRGQHICGGVLIREDIVMTAAHCDGRYTVVLGAHSLEEDENSQQRFLVAQYIPHPRFIELDNDIQLLKLSGRANLSTAVQLIPLMTARVSGTTECTTAGWGLLNDAGALPDMLQEVNATTISRNECRRRWGAGVPISNSMVCATGPSAFQGFCSGDSGGPLVCEGQSAGIVSFSGRRCANPATPDVYTRVASYTRWIRRVLSRV